MQSQYSSICLFITDLRVVADGRLRYVSMKG